MDRRRLLQAGLVGGAGALLAGPTLAAAQPVRVHRGTGPVGSVATLSGAPQGVDPRLFARAREALQRHGQTIRHKDRIGIVDYGIRSDRPRFHLIEMASGYCSSFYVSHGRGSDRNHNGWLDSFSNRHGSNATSSGAYATANRYHGKYGPSMRLHGLDWSNNNAFDRAIVMHPAWYAEADMVRKHGKLGRSEGCFALGQRDHWYVMNLLGTGRMIYADKVA